MIQLPRIDSETTLKAWLDTRPPEDCAIIANRVAMRVAPVWFAAMDDDWARYSKVTAIPVLWANLASAVAHKDSTPEVLGAAVSADLFADNSIPENVPAADLETTDRAAASAAAAVAAGPVTAAHAVDAAISTVTHAIAAAGRASLWSSIETDVHQLTQGTDLTGWRLWKEHNELGFYWDKATPFLRAAPGGEFWVEWYQRVLRGDPQNWPMLRDVALIDEAFWRQGGDALAARIIEIRVAYANSATANGERIEPNPLTGKLRLIPDTQLAEDVAVRVRRKIIKAVEIFDDQSSQIYSALAPDLTVLRHAVADAGNLPVELFDACASAINRLAVRIQNEECPSADRDALICDYRKHLRDAGGDILGSDEETRKVLERRATVIGNDALLNERKAILETVAAVMPLLEGRLAETLPQDAELATNPEFLAELRTVPSFRFSGRLLRIVREIGKGFVAGSGATVSIGSYFQAIEAIYRYFGL